MKSNTGRATTTTVDSNLQSAARKRNILQQKHLPPHPKLLSVIEGKNSSQTSKRATTPGHVKCKKYKNLIGACCRELAIRAENFKALINSLHFIRISSEVWAKWRICSLVPSPSNRAHLSCLQSSSKLWFKIAEFLHSSERGVTRFHTIWDNLSTRINDLECRVVNAEKQFDFRSIHFQQRHVFVEINEISNLINRVQIDWN